MRTAIANLQARLAGVRRVDLVHLPSPFEPMTRMTAHLGGPSLWVKREDCAGGGVGGNKLRKLDYVLAEALEAGADTLVSGGVVQSNSLRQVAAAAARLGLACHLVVYQGRLTPPTAAYETSGNAALNTLFGAISHLVPWTGDRNGAVVALARRLADEGRKPYVVPYGVSNARGALAYASTIVEIAQQSAAAGFTPTAIVHASGSGSTQAGLVLGASVCLPKTRVIGIDVDAEPERVRADVVKYARGAAEMAGLSFDEHDVEVVDGHAGPGYGVPDMSTVNAIRLCGRLEGLVLDPVYAGKGMSGLVALVAQGRWSRDDCVVFIHTGGTPAFFAYVDALGLDGTSIS
jgi:L-cysteate sulfo-lyase